MVDTVPGTETPKAQKKTTKSIFAKPSQASKTTKKSASKKSGSKSSSATLPTASNDIRDKAVAFANTHSLSEAAKKFGYSTKTISRWRIQTKKGSGTRPLTVAKANSNASMSSAAKKTFSPQQNQRNQVVPRINIYLDSLEMLIPMLNAQPRALEYIHERLKSIENLCK